MIGSHFIARILARLPRFAWLALALVWPHWASMGQEKLTYEQHVRPILKLHCFHCHGDDGEKQGKLDLRLARLMKTGGESGPAIVAGKPDESLLIQRIRKGEMPPGKKHVESKELDVLVRWIATGANTASPEPDQGGPSFASDERNWWSFQPIRRAAIPNVQSAGAATSAIDRFLLAKLESHQLSFSPAADRRILARRMWIDLLGLPPSPAEIDEVLADLRPDALERLTDRLLASPHYGERWGRHWLDVAGYADSDGYDTNDVVRKHAWHYRDYVIRSINGDKSFREFIVEQLAGDELVPPPHANLTPQQIDRLAATGFLRMVPDGTVGDPDHKTARNAVVAETIKVVSSSLLGLTVGCSQCHSHKYDPIPQADYYRLRAIFEPGFNLDAWRIPQQRLVSLYTDADRAEAAKIEGEAAKVEGERNQKVNELIEQVFQRELAKLPEDKRELAKQARTTPDDKKTPEHKALIKEFPSLNVNGGTISLYEPQKIQELEKYVKQVAEIRGKKPVEHFLSVLTEIPGQMPKTLIFHRGDPNQAREEVSPCDLSVLPTTVPIAADDPALPTSGRRLAYAKHLTSGQHPLVARVLANRIWMHHFGRGIVGTVSDFGRLGELPSHPELLDWLADEFMAGNWEVKRFERRLINSTAYRQSSARTPQLDSLDPDNRWLGRMSVRRLEAESVRDAILCANGRFIDKAFGPPVPVARDQFGSVVIGEESEDGSGVQVAPKSLAGEEARRSIYVMVRRTRPLSVLESFDLPNMEPNCTIRDSSTVAPQSLMLLNSLFITASSEHLAERVVREVGDDAQVQIQRAWRLVLGRAPSEPELVSSASFVSTQATRFQAQDDAGKEKKPPLPVPATSTRQRALANLCQALLCSNEFLYVE